MTRYEDFVFGRWAERREKIRRAVEMTADPARLFTPEAAIPATYQPEPAPERRLVAAVVQEAVDTYRKNMRAHSAAGRAEFAEAADYIAADDERWPFSFVNACRVLGIDPDALRCALKSITPARKAARPSAGRVPRIHRVVA